MNEELPVTKDRPNSTRSASQAPVLLGDLGVVPPSTSIPSTVNPPANRWGRIRPVILMWALGIPLPLVILVFLFRGCTT